MRTSDERVQELHCRMKAMKDKKSLRNYVIKCTIACAACLVIVVAAAIMVASLPVISSDSAPGAATASIFADHSALGYVVVAILSLCLGAFVTVFCFRMRRHLEDRDEDKNDDRKH